MHLSGACYFRRCSQQANKNVLMIHLITPFSAASGLPVVQLQIGLGQAIHLPRFESTAIPVDLCVTERDKPQRQIVTAKALGVPAHRHDRLAEIAARQFLHPATQTVLGVVGEVATHAHTPSSPIEPGIERFRRYSTVSTMVGFPSVSSVASCNVRMVVVPGAVVGVYPTGFATNAGVRYYVEIGVFVRVIPQTRHPQPVLITPILRHIRITIGIVRGGMGRIVANDQSRFDLAIARRASSI